MDFSAALETKAEEKPEEIKQEIKKRDPMDPASYMHHFTPFQAEIDKMTTLFFSFSLRFLSDFFLLLKIRLDLPIQD